MIPNLLSNVKSTQYRDNRIPNVIGRPVSWIDIYKEDSVTIVFRGANGAKLSVDPGDGSGFEAVSLLGTGTGVNWVHDYTGVSGTKRVFIRGDLDDITRIEFSTLNSVNGFDLGTFSNLEYYVVGGYQRHVNFKGVTNLKKLGYLYENVNSSLVDASALASCNSLYSVTITNCGITDISWAKNLTDCFNINLNNNNSIVYQETAWSTFSGLNFECKSQLSSAEVDQMLIDFAAAGWTRCTLLLDGTNDLRTSASDAAMLLHVGVLNNEVHVNESE